MPRTEDGEFELVLGNKQLLSVFFIIVVLLGVFFTMGYIVGRNSGPVSANAERNSAGTPVTPRPDAPSAMPTGGNAAPAASPSAEPNAPPAGSPGESASPAAAETASQPPAAEGGAEAKPAEAAPGGPIKIVNPEPGQTFVQVSSMLEQPAAEILVDVLGKKGFHAIIAPGPNPGKFRVLVGPVKDVADAGRVRGDLEQAGFKGAFLKRY